MKKILVVEDQEDVREIVRMTLELEGYEIQDADRGASGLALAAQWRPDLVLTDVMMPGGIDGFQVCERIKSDPALKRTKVVILTARNQAQDRKAGQKAGADEFLTKPFSPIELSAIVTRLLR
ncbi:MAG: response regulator [Burkholderiaceae bacterium]|nr:response regulator [Burkholderiaceae bacterium]